MLLDGICENCGAHVTFAPKYLIDKTSKSTEYPPKRCPSCGMLIELTGRKLAETRVVRIGT